MTLIQPQTRRFTRDEYHQMAELGYFENQRVQLIDGEIIEMAPQNEPHVETISRLIRIFSPLVPKDFELRCQAPLSIGNSEPEPDLAIVKLPKPKDSAPHTAALVIEVADSTLATDRLKSHLYASAQVPEYWIIVINDRSVERYTDPVADPKSPFSAKYASTTPMTASDAIRPILLNIPPISITAILAD